MVIPSQTGDESYQNIQLNFGDQSGFKHNFIAPIPQEFTHEMLQFNFCNSLSLLIWETGKHCCGKTLILCQAAEKEFYTEVLFCLFQAIVNCCTALKQRIDAVATTMPKEATWVQIIQKCYDKGVDLSEKYMQASTR